MSERDRGSATVVAAIFLAALLAVVVVVLQLAGAVIARHRAGSAADLAALAGAGLVLLDPGNACGRAGSVAVANGARVVSCEVQGWDVLVTTEVDVRIGVFAGTAGGRARATVVREQG
ncbi:Rv3654c family TadE-like protein [Nakamurella sp. A5-74]|uniref:Rv3654c family TadE-like protein n=1 Tax=Nakamurella sp. A5-74 TaxID=3158264 RepID=A0AAU8DQZ7_9ACTN